MFSRVPTKDMAIETSHEVLHITIRVQMSGNIDLEGNENEELQGKAIWKEVSLPLYCLPSIKIGKGM
jgi:hypothetical protein